MPYESNYSNEILEIFNNSLYAKNNRECNNSYYPQFEIPLKNHIASIIHMDLDELHENSSYLTKLMEFTDTTSDEYILLSLKLTANLDVSDYKYRKKYG